MIMPMSHRSRSADRSFGLSKLRVGWQHRRAFLLPLEHDCNDCKYVALMRPLQANQMRELTNLSAGASRRNPGPPNSSTLYRRLSSPFPPSPVHTPIPLSLFVYTMLAARTSAARNASRFVRRFATVVDTAGVKVAAVDNGEPTSAVTFLVKAGSRYENKPGVAHALQNFAFKVNYLHLV